MSRPHPRRATVPAPDYSRTSRAEGGAGTSRADTPHINPVERFRSEIARPRTGGPRLSRPHPRRAAAPVPSHSWTSRAEGGAGTSRADTPHINLAERFRSEIARRHTGGPRLSRPHPRRATVPAPDYSRTSRAEGGPPGTSAPTTSPPPPKKKNFFVRYAIRPRARRGGRDERDFTPERSEVKSRDATREGRACRGRLGARCPDWPGARSTRAALGAGRPNAPSPVRWP